jgi:hypothetical protein
MLEGDQFTLPSGRAIQQQKTMGVENMYLEILLVAILIKLGIEMTGG